MNNHPLNLLVRFLLEIAALLAFGTWGWYRGGDSFWRWILMLGVPMIASIVWGVFRIPNDPGRAPVAVPGILRLIIELVFFGTAVWALFDLKFDKLAWVLAIMTFVHYIISYDRILRMLQ